MYVTMYYEDGGGVLKWWKAGEVGGNYAKIKGWELRMQAMGGGILELLSWAVGFCIFTNPLPPPPPHVPSSHKAIISC